MSIEISTWDGFDRIGYSSKHRMLQHVTLMPSNIDALESVDDAAYPACTREVLQRLREAGIEAHSLTPLNLAIGVSDYVCLGDPLVMNFMQCWNYRSPGFYFNWATFHENIDVIQVALDVLRSLFESRSETDMDPSVIGLEFSLFVESITTNVLAGAKRFDYRGTFADLPNLSDAVQAAIRFS